MIKSNIIKIALFSFTILILINFNFQFSSETIKVNSNDDFGIIKGNTNPNYINSKIDKIISLINQSLIEKYLLELVSFGPRMTGTYGCEKAAEYIFSQFKNFNIEANYYPWQAWGNKWHFRFFKGVNIEGTHIGKSQQRDEVIIFNAHYDTVENTIGANDDGSGTVAVLAAADVLSKFDFNRTLKFVTFSGEEIGLRGSRQYVKDISEKDSNVILEINADMIGRATSEETGRKMTLVTSEDAKWIPGLVENISLHCGLKFNFGYGNLNRDAKRGGSDYFYFLKYGYESLVCWQGEGDPNMHTPQDNLNNVNISYLVNTTRHIASLMAVLADNDLEKPQIKIVSPKKGRLYFEDRTIKKYRFEKTKIINQFTVYTRIVPGKYPIDRVEFYLDEKLEYVDPDAPYFYMFNNRAIGPHTIRVIAYDKEQNNATDKINIQWINLLKRK